MLAFMAEKKRLIAEAHALRADLDKMPKGSSERSAAMLAYNALVKKIADYPKGPPPATAPPAPAAKPTLAPKPAVNGKTTSTSVPVTKAAPAPAPVAPKKPTVAAATTTAAIAPKKPTVAAPAPAPKPAVTKPAAAKPVPSIAAKLQAVVKTVKAQAKPVAPVAPKKTANGKKKVYGTEDDDVDDAESLEGGEEDDIRAEYVDPLQEALELAADSDGAVLTGDAEEKYAMEQDAKAAKRRLKYYLDMRSLGVKKATAYLQQLEPAAREAVLADANEYDLQQVREAEEESDEDYVPPAVAAAAGACVWCAWVRCGFI